jgi:hypothetical protein
LSSQNFSRSFAEDFTIIAVQEKSRIVGKREFLMLRFASGEAGPIMKSVLNKD